MARSARTRLARQVYGFLVAMLLASPVIADARTVAVLVDRTKSVYSPELLDLLPRVADRISQAAAQCTGAITVSAAVWDGGPLSLRVPKTWTLASLSVAPCESRWKARCDYLRERAQRALAEQRAPCLTAMNRWLREAGTVQVVSLKVSCTAPLYSAAELADFSVVITDAAGEGECGGQKEPTARPGRHTLIIVLARGGDGILAQERIGARVAHLRSLGYWAIDGRQVETLNWTELICGSGGGE